MTTVEAIKSIKDLKNIEKILKNRNYRDFVFFKMGVNLGLRISDILNLDVKDVKNKDIINIIEKKTKKKKRMPINDELQNIIKNFTKYRRDNEPLFMGNSYNNRISRVTAYRIINAACKEAHLEGNFGTHTLRKTFGYHFYKKFKDIAMLQKMLNHSHPNITLRYIGIDDEMIFNSYKNFNL